MNGEGKNYFAAGAFSGSGPKASLGETVTIYKMNENPKKSWESWTLSPR
jgi:hypothetical protein